MIGTSQFLKYFGRDDCTDLSLKMLGKSIKSIPDLDIETSLLKLNIAPLTGLLYL